MRILLLLGVLFATSCGGCRQTLIDPNTALQADVALDIGLAAFDTGQDDIARVQFERVSSLLPDEAAGHANLGLLALRRQEGDRADEALETAARLAPASPTIARMRASAFSSQGRSRDAVAELRQALQRSPADRPALFALALALESLTTDTAIRDAAQTMAGLPGLDDDPAAILESVRLLARAGDFSRATAQLDRGKELWPATLSDRVGTLRSALAAQDARAAGIAAAFLKNVLQQDPRYRAAREALDPAGGEPVRQLLSVQAARPGAWPADDSLQFALRTEPVDSPTADVAVLFADGMTPAVVSASPRGVLAGTTRVLDGAAVSRVMAADVTHDFQEDLVIVSGNRVRVLAREGSAWRQLRVPQGPPTVRAVWPADVDLDGDLDLVTAIGDGVEVLRNNTDGTFVSIRPFPGVPRVRDFVWSDVDDEGTPDAVFLTDTGTVLVVANARAGRFLSPSALGVSGVTALAVADLEATGTFDVVTTSAAGGMTRTHFDPEQQRWTSVAMQGMPPLPGEVDRLMDADLDNNGSLDWVVSVDGQTIVLLSSGPGYRALAPLAMDTSAVADLTADGVLELIGRTPDGHVAVASATLMRGYRGQVVQPRAAALTGDQRINTFAIGGEVAVSVAGRRVRRRITGPQVHVGLGAEPKADVIRITWPNGVLQSEFDVPAGASIRADQRLKGSCPWLFGWNGSEMQFLTDVIWRSPLGLRINAQATADVLMTEDRVRIPGDRLVARDGHYDLRITAELWETHFFDHVGLDVVDHPAGTELWIDERFAIPAPSLEPIVTGPLQPLLSATDDQGRDVSDVVAARDDHHLAFAGLGTYQGITRRHAIEFELPDSAPRRGPLWLIATGWVHPTDSSVNVAISHGAHAPPSGLALEVETAPGTFTTVKAGLGFPSGKDKNVLIDLSGVFPLQGRRRARLVTNLEIYWDRLGWAEGRPDVRVSTTSLRLLSADLRSRGFSRTVQPVSSVPERPVYSAITGTGARWRDLEGYYTRFGPVDPLLAGVDDRYVIMNAGDELRMQFASAPPVASGMVRQFLFTGDGWVKDGDFNTSFSRTVLPLPTHASGRYDRAPSTLENDPVYQAHRSDFETYHTRYVAPRVR